MLITHKHEIKEIQKDPLWRTSLLQYFVLKCASVCHVILLCGWVSPSNSSNDNEVTGSYHDIKFIEITVDETMFCQANNETYNYLKNHLWALQFAYLHTAEEIYLIIDSSNLARSCTTKMLGGLIFFIHQIIQEKNLKSEK